MIHATPSWCKPHIHIQEPSHKFCISMTDIIWMALVFWKPKLTSNENHVHQSHARSFVWDVDLLRAEKIHFFFLFHGFRQERIESWCYFDVLVKFTQLIIQFFVFESRVAAQIKKENMTLMEIDSCLPIKMIKSNRLDWGIVTAII